MTRQARPNGSSIRRSSIASLNHRILYGTCFASALTTATTVANFLASLSLQRRTPLQCLKPRRSATPMCRAPTRSRAPPIGPSITSEQLFQPQWTPQLSTLQLLPLALVLVLLQQLLLADALKALAAHMPLLIMLTGEGKKRALYFVHCTLYTGFRGFWKNGY